MSLYPFKFHPILKERLWGGTKLQSVLEKPITSDITGESWELSAVPGDISVVANGELANITLQEMINEAKGALLGEKVYERFGAEFPILIKFIDAKQDLSIQVHPNDELAKERHNSFGKTEMWYIMQADPGSELIVGFNKDVTKAEYQEHLDNNTVTDLMNYETVQEGDTFFINTGTIHAIGAGIILAEIQQTSDVTYRVYDFNRKDKEGNLRELHTEMALDAITYEKKDDFKVEYKNEENVCGEMVDCPYFTTNYWNITKETKIDVTERDSFTIFMCTKGAATISTPAGAVEIKKGETVLLPADSKEITISEDAVELLEVYIS